MLQVVSVSHSIFHANFLIYTHVQHTFSLANTHTHSERGFLNAIVSNLTTDKIVGL